MIAEYFYDSWAIMASFGSPAMKPCFREGRGKTTWLNLMELYWSLLRDGATEAEAEETVSSFRPVPIEFTFEEVKGAMSLRFDWRKRVKAISYADAIGYHLARSRRMLFLTGDPAFKRAPGATFIRIPG